MPGTASQAADCLKRVWLHVTDICKACIEQITKQRGCHASRRAMLTGELCTLSQPFLICQKACCGHAHVNNLACAHVASIWMLLVCQHSLGYAACIAVGEGTASCFDEATCVQLAALTCWLKPISTQYRGNKECSTEVQGTDLD